MIRYTVPKDARKAVREALRGGFTMITGRKHAKLRSPDGKHTIIIPSSPRDSQAAAKDLIREINSYRRVAA